MASFAFVIGVNNYVADHDGLKPLTGAVNDSIAFAKWVQEPMGGNVPAENLYHIMSPEDGDLPTRHDTEQKLHHFIERLEGGALNDKFYFYFAGHGVAHPDEIDHNLLCLSDWTKQWCNNALASVPAISFFRYLGVFQEMIFIFDCCRTRYFRARLNEFIAPNIRIGEHDNASIFIAFSTANKSAFQRENFTKIDELPNDMINPLFEATVQAVEEAIINAMVAAETTEGINGNKAYALPHGLVIQLLKKYNRIK